MSKQSDRPKRCYHHECKAKLRLTDINCAYCKTHYCMKHRLPEQHNCPHDFRKVHKEQSKLLADAMRCIAPKIDIITSS